MSEAMDYNFLRNPNLDLFLPYHDYEWATEMFDLVKDTKVDRALSYLIAQWWRGSEAFRFPTIMMSALKTTSDVFLQRKEPFFDAMFGSVLRSWC